MMTVVMIPPIVMTVVMPPPIMPVMVPPPVVAMIPVMSPVAPIVRLLNDPIAALGDGLESGQIAANRAGVSTGRGEADPQGQSHG